mgnify:CR=1 FL=1
MSFEEILEAEYGKGKVYIDYREDSNNVTNIRIISKDSKKEFRAEVILSSCSGFGFRSPSSYLRIVPTFMPDSSASCI